MKTKLNISWILSLAVLLLLPAFAAAGPRRAAKKAVPPPLYADSSDTTEYEPDDEPEGGMSGEDTEAPDSENAPDADIAPDAFNHGTQSTGGAGISAGQGITAPSGGTPGTGPGSSPGSSGPGKLTGNPVSGASGPGADLCAAYGLPNTIERTKAGSSWREQPDLYFHMPANGAYVFTFKTGVAGTRGSSSTLYSPVNQYMTISKNKCDFSPMLPSVCGKGGPETYIRWKVGGASDNICCILEPNTLYYVNLRDAVLSGGRFTNTCPRGGCAFRIY